ncbi:MAG: zinc-binding dehydrogenase [Chloroflexota bacterium]
MTQHGRLLAYDGLGQPLRFVERPMPQPESGAAVVKISLGNVCGSDLHVWRGELDLKKIGRALPRNLGHEGCGTIAALGAGVTTDAAGAPLAIGDRVVFRYSFSCGSCRGCLSGNTRFCPHQSRHLATSCDEWPFYKGTFGDYTYLFPGHVMFKVPDALSDEMVAGINCAFSTVMCGLDVASVGLGDTVVIQGAGGLGLYAAAIARERGAARVIAIDGVAERLDLASGFGADVLLDLRELSAPDQRVERVRALTDGWGADVVVDVAGFPGVIEEGLQMVGNGGRYVEIGTIAPDMSLTLVPTTLNQRNVQMLGIGYYEPRHLKAALDMMSRTRASYPFDRVVSQVFPLEQAQHVFDQQAAGRITRAALKP